LLKAKGLKERIIQVIDISDRESQYLEIIPLCTLISQKFAAGEYKTVNIEYTRYINSLKSVPTHKKILPIDKDVFVDSSVEVKYKDTILSEEGKVIQFEPGPLSILDNSTIVFLSTVIQAAVAESKVSENTTRMNNMQAATDNANDLIATLTLKYNKLRQEQITQEINEIVQGAGSE
jgi:F-type H+-transporting ATPase subunit gamma